jgi:hypothetical protein
MTPMQQMLDWAKYLIQSPDSSTRLLGSELKGKALSLLEEERKMLVDAVNTADKYIEYTDPDGNYITKGDDYYNSNFNQE